LFISRNKQQTKATKTNDLNAPWAARNSFTGRMFVTSGLDICACSGLLS